MGEAADFFVSYTSTDRTWAEWIAWQLEAEGNQVVSRSSLGLHPRAGLAHEVQQAIATGPAGGDRPHDLRHTFTTGWRTRPFPRGSLMS
jgi:TIR domain